jgi:hypothetical protein
MTEHTVEELEAMLAAAKAKVSHEEFPKWVVPHESHVHQAGDHLSAPLFPDHHVDREGKLTVLVRDADEEAKALAAKETA